MRHGFLFWSVGEAYPEHIHEVAAFAERHADFIKQERSRNPEGYRQIEEAISVRR